MMLRSLRQLAAVLFATLCLALPAGAQEADPDRIPRFAADIAVQENGDLLVTEEIDFAVMPGSFKHGIYRDFPTTYRGFLGLAETVGFEVLEVTRDGTPERFVLLDGLAGVRLRIGRENVLLENGVHRYRLVYRTTRQLFFHSNRDEVYWDVTGNEWAHPIDRAEATIQLPPGAVARETAGYTGYAGEDGPDFTETQNPDGTVTFATTRALQPGEGLTVAVAFTKGYVAEPGLGEKLRRGLADNLGLAVAFLGLLAAVAYFFIQWRRVGRDPESGVIIPLYEAPEGLSPAATGYVWAQARGTGLGRAKTFAVALTSLAIKGLLTIEENQRRYTLTRGPGIGPGPGTTAKLPPGEAAVMMSLFSENKSSVVIKPDYTPAIRAAMDEINDVLAREHANAYFRHNLGFWLLGMLLAFAGTIGGLAVQAGSLEPLPFIGIGALFGTAFTVPVVIIGRQLAARYLRILRGDARLSAGEVVMTLFVLPFMVPGLGALYFMYDFFGLPLAVVTVAQLANLVLFWHLLKAPTRLGREMLDRIEGYRLYLSVAEADRLNMLTAEPEMTLDLFEQHLPYAMALDVETEWTARFTAGASAAAQQAAKARQQHWYRSHSGVHDLSAATSSLSSGLSSTLSTAATRPSSSSSSGSSGGGSSGGGGGGGGGGSW